VDALLTLLDEHEGGPRDADSFRELALRHLAASLLDGRP
jgi:hypothetical protein